MSSERESLIVGSTARMNEEQKCPHCRRKYKINYIKRGKKFHWEPVAIDYSYEAEGRPLVGNRLEREFNERNGKREY